MEVNPSVWYGTRELPDVPPHFVKTSAPVTSESLFWVKSKLVGRYSVYIVPITLSSRTLTDSGNTVIYFENPGEAMMYELRWSGSK